MPPKPSSSLRPGTKRGGDDTGGAAGVDLHAVERFVRTAPDLQRLLTSPATSQRELLLRAQMRRTAAMLAGWLEEAARGERRTARATVYRAAALVAESLAAAPVTAGAIPVGDDH
jgi:hypothetical protein